MTDSTGGPLGPVKVPARNNVYTVLAGIAALLLLVGVIYVLSRNMQLYGGPLPTEAPSNSSHR